jgi:polo-like kinase 1
MTDRKMSVTRPARGQIIWDPQQNTRYKKGRFLGKGNFGSVYKATDVATGENVAVKIIPKSKMAKMLQEIVLLKSVSHIYIFKLFSHFEDRDSVYVILELCNRHSLKEMLQSCKTITDHETRYFMRQILLGCQYLHENKIIHRDLKPANILINDQMEIKLGNFGLATKVDRRELKKTRCGTPSYMAGVREGGYSYEVDVWSLGCILYTLLVGKSPFETQTQKDTYNRIRKNEYNVPSEVGLLAKSLIKKLLQHNPRKRPKIVKILSDDFMTTGYLPPRLPVSCLVTAPRFDTNLSSEFNAQCRREVRAARERAVFPLEQRMTKCCQLLEDKKISAFSTLKKELHKIESSLTPATASLRAKSGSRFSTSM